jgi:hypothetical protein
VATGFESGRCTGADVGKDGLPEIVTANVRAGSVSFVTNTTWSAPASARVLRGVLVSGGVLQARVSDDSHMTVRNGEAATTAHVMVEFAAQAPLFIPASITFTLEAKATTTGLVQRIDLFDWVAGSWVEVDARPAPLVDQVVEVPVIEPARFVNAGSRSMKARVRLKAEMPGVPSWALQVDRVAWTVR